MATAINWPYSILIVLLLWLLLSLVKRVNQSWPKKLRVIDLMILPMWWSMEAMTFQSTHYSVVGPMMCMFLIWGIALAIYQTFGTQQFVIKRFLLNWWRIIGIVTLVVYVLVIVMTLWQLK
ncbi:hypothetical protein JOC36_001409 [Weissella uvarum]|uniref:DUF3397 family protein n=1 Tax=Weissella uvarum TaxID=1479233 RepID=UPI00195F5223|nr:DUF3397 family protein [Weissella uvarum]MBM7617832.1 hypothetical protein [Weissella uvarum]MCM0595789.1 DUF3397 family protein [Weissella uvarum]